MVTNDMMNFAKYILLFGCLGVVAAPAQHVIHRQWSYRITTTILGHKYTQQLSSADRKDYPEWKFDHEPCPLPATNAAASARSALIGLIGDHGEPEMKSFTLKQLYQDIWIYEFSFSVKGLSEGEKKDCSILVGLDGHVPALTLKPDTSASPAAQPSSTAPPAPAPEQVTESILPTVQPE